MPSSLASTLYFLGKAISQLRMAKPYPDPQYPMILDCHCHIASHRIMPPAFFSGWSRTIRSSLPLAPASEEDKRIDELLHELNDDPDCVSMLREMNEAGIEKAILLV